VKALRVHPRGELRHREKDRFTLGVDDPGLLPINRAAVDFTPNLALWPKQVAQHQPSTKASLPVPFRHGLNAETPLPESVLVKVAIDLLDERSLLWQSFIRLPARGPFVIGRASRKAITR